jgi:hypothetical protein
MIPRTTKQVKRQVEANKDSIAEDRSKESPKNSRPFSRIGQRDQMLIGRILSDVAADSTFTGTLMNYDLGLVTGDFADLTFICVASEKPNALAGRNFLAMNWGGVWYCVAVIDRDFSGHTGGKSLGTNRRARTTEAATANNHITCNILDSSGAEATEGEEFEVEVYIDIADGGTALNTSSPRLRNDEYMTVTLLPLTTSTERWYCTTVFQPTEDCEVEE